MVDNRIEQLMNLCRSLLPELPDEADLQESFAGEGDGEDDVEDEEVDEEEDEDRDDGDGGDDSTQAKTEGGEKESRTKSTKVKPQAPARMAWDFGDEDEDEESENENEDGKDTQARRGWDFGDEDENEEEEEEEEGGAQEQMTETNDPRRASASDETALEGAGGAGGTLAQSSKRRMLIGMVGQPNTGKSSLINALLGRPAVGVSQTPGKTKYLQTIIVDDDIMVCDCPGLVFPALDIPKPLQAICGVYPLPQLREPYTSVQYLAERVPLEAIYNLPTPDKLPSANAGLTCRTLCPSS